MPRIDREVLDLGVRWVGYGGADPEDIFIMFGWSETQYYERLRILVERHILRNETLRNRLLGVCDGRPNTNRQR